jgi:hypothetical protein
MRRTRQAVKAYKENASTSKRSNSGIPSTASIILNSRSCKIPIVYPKFKTKEAFEAEPNSKVFVEMTVEARKWLNTFSSEIIDSGHMEQYTFYNSSLDYKNPGISAFRITNEFGFAQVQVRQIPDNPTLFQLDYFESTESGEILLKLIGLCNLVNYEHPVVDVVYSTYYDPEKARDYGSLIATTFQDVMVYVRPWDYTCGSKECTVMPIIPCWTNSEKNW